MSSSAIDRRQHERFALVPMYTAITLERVADMKIRSRAGHAYDISEGGARIELDDAVETGERVTLHIGLPGERWSISVTGEIAWVASVEDDPGPRRAAVRFVAFASPDDRARLLRFLGSGLAPRAA